MKIMTSRPGWALALALAWTAPAWAGEEPASPTAVTKEVRLEYSKFIRDTKLKSLYRLVKAKGRTRGWKVFELRPKKLKRAFWDRLPKPAQADLPWKKFLEAFEPRLCVVSAAKIKRVVVHRDFVSIRTLSKVVSDLNQGRTERERVEVESEEPGIDLWYRRSGAWHLGRREILGKTLRLTEVAGDVLISVEAKGVPFSVVAKALTEAADGPPRKANVRLTHEAYEAFRAERLKTLEGLRVADVGEFLVAYPPTRANGMGVLFRIGLSLVTVVVKEPSKALVAQLSKYKRGTPVEFSAIFDSHRLEEVPRTRTLEDKKEKWREPKVLFNVVLRSSEENLQLRVR